MLDTKQKNIPRETSSFERAKDYRRIREKLSTSRRKYDLLGKIILVMIVAVVIYSFYSLYLQPKFSKQIPTHQSQSLDRPPEELTSFQVRSGSKVFTPVSITIDNDSLIVAVADSPTLHLFSRELKPLKVIELKRPQEVIPTTIIVRDTILIVADQTQGVCAIYERDGFYLTSISWYPDEKERVRPVHISTDGRFLTLTDPDRRVVSLISLVEEKPFYQFLELLLLIPSRSATSMRAPYCAQIVPDGRIWVGDNGAAYIYSLEGKLLAELEQPQRTKISHPSDFALLSGDSGENSRVHMVDREAGKVFVYDLAGRLTLVYPQDRNLSSPNSIAINAHSRRIFIAESGRREITVFGY